MFLSDLPNEMLLWIFSNLDELSDMNAFSQASRHFYNLTTDELYRISEKRHPGRAIQWAAKVGNLASANKLIEKCNNCLSAVKDRQPIIIAAENGHMELVELFLSHSFPNDTAKEEYQAEAIAFRKSVIGAVRYCHENVVKLLFKYKPHIAFYKRNFFAAFPLCAAARYNRLSLVELLIKSKCGANDHPVGKKTPLAHTASIRPTTPSESKTVFEIVRLLVRAGANVDNDGDSMLEVIKSRNIPLLQLLMENGFSPQNLSAGDILNEFSRTRRKDQEMASLLLSWLDVDAVIASGSHQRWNLFKGAIFHDLDELTKTLVQEKHFLDKRYQSERAAIGCCPINLAACYGREKTIQLLVAHGASPNGESRNQRALELALNRRPSLGTAKILLDSGANGALALESAINKKIRPVVELIAPYVPTIVL
jgi:ankyrin repeat protein